MKTLLALAVALTACSHPSSTKAPEQKTAMIDPTLPSWAPKSCSAYHVAVVEVTDCLEVSFDVRESIKAKYEAANTAWHDMTNAPPQTIDQIDILCTDDVRYVHQQGAGKCMATASR